MRLIDPNEDYNPLWDDSPKIWTIPVNFNEIKTEEIKKNTPKPFIIEDPSSFGITKDSKRLELNKYSFLFFSGQHWSKGEYEGLDITSFTRFVSKLKIKGLKIDSDKYWKDNNLWFGSTKAYFEFIPGDISKQLNDCGAVAIKNMNATSSYNYNSYMQALIDIYYFLYYLEYLVTSYSFVTFSQYDYKSPESEYKPFVAYGNIILPKLSELAQEAAQYSNMWHPLNHPRYDFEHILKGETKSARNHYLGVINYHGLNKFYREYFIPKYQKVLPDLFDGNENLLL